MLAGRFGWSEGWRSKIYIYCKFCGKFSALSRHHLIAQKAIRHLNCERSERGSLSVGLLCSSNQADIRMPWTRSIRPFLHSTCQSNEHENSVCARGRFVSGFIYRFLPFHIGITMVATQRTTNGGRMINTYLLGKKKNERERKLTQNKVEARLHLPQRKKLSHQRQPQRLK